LIEKEENTVSRIIKAFVFCRIRKKWESEKLDMMIQEDPAKFAQKVWDQYSYDIFIEDDSWPTSIERVREVFIETISQNQIMYMSGAKEEAMLINMYEKFEKFEKFKF
jgi:hypothetical protein